MGQKIFLIFYHVLYTAYLISWQSNKWDLQNLTLYSCRFLVIGVFRFVSSFGMGTLCAVELSGLFKCLGGLCSLLTLYVLWTLVSLRVEQSNFSFKRFLVYFIYLIEIPVCKQRRIWSDVSLFLFCTLPSDARHILVVRRSHWGFYFRFLLFSIICKCLYATKCFIMRRLLLFFFVFLFLSLSYDNLNVRSNKDLIYSVRNKKSPQICHSHNFQKSCSALQLRASGPKSRPTGQLVLHKRSFD